MPYKENMFCPHGGYLLLTQQIKISVKQKIIYKEKNDE